MEPGRWLRPNGAGTEQSGYGREHLDREAGRGHVLPNRRREFFAVNKPWKRQVVMGRIVIRAPHAQTGHLHNLHASAQLGERLLTEKQWSETEYWNLKDWGGFCVPFAGNEESEDGSRTRFLKASHRELQN